MKICVTATSFIKNTSLKSALESRFSDCSIHYIDNQDVEEFLCHHKPDGWIVGRERVDYRLLESLDSLKIISKYGVGVDNIDFNAAKRFGVKVGFTPGVNAVSVAEFTIGMIISLSRNISLGSRLLSNGIWRKNGGVNFSNSTIGIVGCGHVGSKVGSLARGFGCRVLINDIEDRSDVAVENGFEVFELDQLLEVADFVTLHVPLTEKTNGFIDLSRLSRIGPDGFLINTSRGEVVVQNDLKMALAEKKIAGAACDVFENEPLEDKALYQLKNFVGTPHIAGNSHQAVLAMGKAAINNLSEGLNPQRGNRNERSN